MTSAQNNVALLSNTSPPTAAPDAPGVIVKHKYDKPSFLPIIRRVLVLAVAFGICLFLAATWFAQGVSWIYDSNLNTWPIIDCPGFIINTRDSHVDGPRCSTSIAYADSLARYIASIGLSPSDSHPSQYKGKCIIPDDFEDDIVCYNRRPCDRTCSTFPIPGRCPDPDTLPYVETVSIYKQDLCMVILGDNPLPMPLVIPCKEVSIGSYCDSSFKVTPSNMTAIRGLILGAAVVLFIWFMGELILRNVDITLSKERAEGMARQAVILPAKRQELRGRLEESNVSIWEVHTWLDLIIFIDVILDTGLFLAAAITVKWPRAPVFSRHLQGALESVARQTEDNNDDHAAELASENSEDSGSFSGSSTSTDTRSLSFVLKQSLTHDCCLMIACHESTMTRERYELFSGTLRAALMVFPPSHIFVCDNGNSPEPVDDTQMATIEAHPDINYIYVPEGNKTFAFYWCNKFWVPFLARHSKVPNFKYAVIIDDDVPLPADLHIPHEHLRNHPDIKAVHFPITATAPDGRRNMLVRCQDVEYKLAAVHKLFQSTLSRCLSCHGAIALWERRALEMIFYEHDTVFHGEDMYMGLCLLHRRDDSKIISCAQSVVPTYAPASFPMLFRQRVKSWELTSHRKTFTYIKEVLSPASFCHAASLILKPYFLQEVLTILLDWLRTFLLTGLLLRDWIGLLLMTSVFTCLL
ncbi:hypothetical protein Pmar_PMAR028527 [Perkinsus marinus ATCC 50983]|uniref:Glycosyltransferase 2-like domain-containing protein n=1 Tax=Perkinsus marinus (strain ATCC 50983 / TXsc) TaxID=423536 RepID=C5LMD6_PERM5|nr:hypothetical protein Pmar_PMAR028527 [Perkinsus marinus ATCC 50983]EER02148.1 hypothetical protein Pmar_PMAR028527 [Perkinsus marinus ATCC 50983]|eukprot:XP_002769430.1 hypothetical protein Pmar_PMAR028527 [Perkinsus marinus ATCC 50983]